MGGCALVYGGFGGGQQWWIFVQMMVVVGSGDVHADGQQQGCGGSGARDGCSVVRVCIVDGGRLVLGVRRQAWWIVVVVCCCCLLGRWWPFWVGGSGSGGGGSFMRWVGGIGSGSGGSFLRRLLWIVGFRANSFISGLVAHWVCTYFVLGFFFTLGVRLVPCQSFGFGLKRL